MKILKWMLRFGTALLLFGGIASLVMEKSKNKYISINDYRNELY